MAICKLKPTSICGCFIEKKNKKHVFKFAYFYNSLMYGKFHFRRIT